MKLHFHPFYLLSFLILIATSSCAIQDEEKEVLQADSFVEQQIPTDTVDLDFYEVNSLEDVRTYFLAEGFTAEKVESMLNDEVFLTAIEADKLGQPVTERCYECDENYIGMTSMENSGAWGYVYLSYRQGNSIPLITLDAGDGVIVTGLVSPRFIQRCTYKRGFANMVDSGTGPKECPGPGGNQFTLTFRDPNNPPSAYCARGEVVIGEKRRANCP
ncbi:MAG: hypothetical protein AAFV78_06440 [Bacteroidota bacterium]